MRAPDRPPAAARLSVVVVSHHSRDHLPGCLAALAEAARALAGGVEVVVVDNASGDGTADWLELAHPEVRLVRSPVNTGYAGGNNLGFAIASGELLAVVGPDVEVAPGCLAALAAELADETCGLVTGRVLLHDRPDRINTCGNRVHVSGLGFARGLGLPAEAGPAGGPVASVSGCLFMTRRDVLDRVGGFDQSFFTYVEDTDLSLRAWLAGLEVRYRPDAVATHRYRLNMSPAKFEHLERNRHLMFQQNLRAWTLFLLLPVFVLAELQQWLYALGRGDGYPAAKARSWRWLLGHRGQVGRRRAESRARRTGGDRPVLRRLDPRLAADQVLGRGLAARVLAALAAAAYALAFLPARLLAL